MSGARSLQKLFVVGNQIAVLPDMFSHWTALVELNLSSNKLNTLPPSLCTLPALLHLNLSWNSLRFLPDEVRGLTHPLRRQSRLPDTLLSPRFCRSWATSGPSPT